MNKKKTILYIWKSPYPWDVRVEKICKSLAKEFNVILLARWGGEAEEQELFDGLLIKRVGYKKKGFYSSPYSFNSNWKNAIQKVIAEEYPCLIITREIMLAEMSSKLAAKHNIPHIIDMAENYPAAMKEWKKYYDHLGRRIAVHYLKIPDITEKRAVKNTNYIITVCKEQNDRLRNQYNFPEENIQIIHNSTGLNTFSKIERKSPESEFIFGHHGYLSDDKNIDKFIIAFDEAKIKYGINIKLYLNGDGESRQKLESMVEKLDLKNDVLFFGSYQYHELDSILNKYDYGIIPYNISDFNNTTIHNKFYDYIAKSTPVLATATKPYSRLFKISEIGVLADSKDKNDLAAAINQITKLNFSVLSNNAGKLFEEQMNWETDENQLLNFVNKLISKNG